MFPFIRLIKEFVKFRNSPPLGVMDVHVSHHLCWPWDLDIWREMNNGRVLSIYDLGRLPLAGRVGLIKALRKHRWGLTMAGAVVRYRRRVRLFDRIEMRSRALCWDARFFYIEQSMWVGGTCASHIVYRSAVTDRNGIVDPALVLAEIAPGLASPPAPDWVAAWIAAEDQRPWPPMQDMPTPNDVDVR